MGTDIPLWIGGLQKWVTGVNKHTTCEEIIKAVLSSNENHHHHSKSGGKSHHRDPKYYVIVERWHKVERPLDPRSRLLKVWNTWGLEQCNVRFLLKRAHHAQTSSSTPRDIKSHRRKVSTRSVKTWHPRKLRSESEDDGSVGCCLEDDDQFPATEEQLKNLIASQNDAITSQLKRLREKDEEIEVIENEIHTQRMHQIGVNYVLDTYLAETSEGDTSSSGGKNNSNSVHANEKVKNDTKPQHSKSDKQSAESSETVCDILDHCIELYEKVLQICDQVHQEELTIKELTNKIQNSIKLKDSAKLECRILLDDDPEIAYAGPERLDEILKRTKRDIERLLRINQTQQLTIQQNDQTLVECTKIIEDKHYYLQQLRTDLERLDKDNVRLQEEFSSVQVVSVDRNVSCDIPENGDSNSDTGLSSLHSSSDDGANVLDTLV
ncbi:ras association domain-containing protein 10-like [Uloborus diversus]|uniref:ras association domain-containing protein 10-like n=1 Tax=Uloborus diversus TaxID=327109 RepID=UPI00240A6A37|nr:ras association domain-containing protein 10-like [Uloborus diversus]XP_054720782.1 ras association domain-containing protein 10-like [Uloborus diversus]XP_054720788.1 ras association domain-containing protein 10-like [Uloborus diversus]